MHIVIFIQPGCPPCDALKAYLSAKGIEYEDRDVSVDQAAAQDLVYKYGSHSTPTTVIGEEILVGFDPERLDQLLGQ